MPEDEQVCRSPGCSGGPSRLEKRAGRFSQLEVPATGIDPGEPGPFRKEVEERYSERNLLGTTPEDE